MNISETMASIRWMMEKHLGKYERTSGAPIGIKPATKTDYIPPRPPVRSAFVLEALSRYEKGERIKDISIAMGSTPTTVGNIVHRKNSYADLPYSEKDIIVFMQSKNRQ